MRYSDLEKLMSSERMRRYLQACHNNSRKAMTLYRQNLRLSQEMFTIISCFEVTLRNAIDSHLSSGPLGNDWLRNAIQPGGIFDRPAIKDTRRIIYGTYEKIMSKGSYSKEKLLTQMEFGIWKYMFARHQFKATGSTLLKIFPYKPKSSQTIQYNNSYIFNELNGINVLRNRIAHHEPICFAQNHPAIDTTYILSSYNRIQTLFTWMGIDAKSLLYGLDHIASHCKKINTL